MTLFGWAGLADLCRSTPTGGERVWFCRARGSALPALGRPGAGRSTRHYSLDSALIRRGSGTAANHRPGAVAAPQCRQSRRLADRAVFFPARRPIAGPVRGRSRDPRLWCDDGGVPASRGPPLGTLWQNRRSRSRRRGVAGVATALVGVAGPPVLIYPLLAGTAAQTVRATLLAFFALSYGATLASHAATVGIPGPPGWRPASLCPLLCWVALSVGRSATAWVATALPCWRSRCSPPPGFIRWRPRVSVF